MMVSSAWPSVSISMMMEFDMGWIGKGEISVSLFDEYEDLGAGFEGGGEPPGGIGFGFGDGDFVDAAVFCDFFLGEVGVDEEE